MNEQKQMSVMLVAKESYWMVLIPLLVVVLDLVGLITGGQALIFMIGSVVGVRAFRKIWGRNWHRKIVEKSKETVEKQLVSASPQDVAAIQAKVDVMNAYLVALDRGADIDAYVDILKVKDRADKALQKSIAKRTIAEQAVAGAVGDQAKAVAEANYEAAKVLVQNDAAYVAEVDKKVEAVLDPSKAEKNPRQWFKLSTRNAILLLLFGFAMRTRIENMVMHIFDTAAGNEPGTYEPYQPKNTFDLANLGPGAPTATPDGWTGSTGSTSFNPESSNGSPAQVTLAPTIAPTVTPMPTATPDAQDHQLLYQYWCGGVSDTSDGRDRMTGSNDRFNSKMFDAKMVPEWAGDSSVQQSVKDWCQSTIMSWSINVELITQPATVQSIINYCEANPEPQGIPCVDWVSTQDSFDFALNR